MICTLYDFREYLRTIKEIRKRKKDSSAGNKCCNTRLLSLLGAIYPYKSLAILKGKRELLDYSGDYSILVNDLEIREMDYRKFPPTFKKRCMLRPWSMRDDARISGSKNGVPGTCRPSEPVPSRSHVTRVSPFRDVQWDTIFKYSWILLKPQSRCCELYFGRKRNRKHFMVGVCLYSFGFIRLESDVNLLCLERIIIFLAVYICPSRTETFTEKNIKFWINNRFSAINLIVTSHRLIQK